MGPFGFFRRDDDDDEESSREHALFRRFGESVTPTNVIANRNRQRDKSTINPNEIDAGGLIQRDDEQKRKLQAEMNKQAASAHKGRRPRLKFWQFEPKMATSDVERARRGGSSNN